MIIRDRRLQTLKGVDVGAAVSNLLKNRFGSLAPVHADFNTSAVLRSGAGDEIHPHSRLPACCLLGVGTTATTSSAAWLP